MVTDAMAERHMMKAMSETFTRQVTSLVRGMDTLERRQGPRKHGGGAVCDRVCTGGQWNPEERTMHINCLELLAAFLAVKQRTKQT